MPAHRPSAAYALLSSSKPQRSLAAYTIAGLASSAIAGAIVVLVLHGVRLETGSSTVNAVIELAGGVAALGFAAGIATGWVRGGTRSEHPKHDSRIKGGCVTRPCAQPPWPASPPISPGCSIYSA